MATRPHIHEPQFYRPRFTEMDQVRSLMLLNEAAQNISSILDLDELIDKIVNEVAIKFGCVETSIWLRDEAANEMVAAGVKGCSVNHKGTRLRIGRDGMIGHVAETGRMLYAPDVTKDPYYIACEPGMMAELDLPLLWDGRVIGVFNAVSPELDGFSEKQIVLLQKLAQHIAVAVHNARLFSHDRAEREEARRIQQALFPKNSPVVSGYVIDGHCAPAGAVGGDWYDYINLPGGKIGLVLADVSGKGMPAAMLMSATRGVLRSLATTISSPAEVLAALNRFLVSDLPPEKFVTMVYAVLDPKTHTVTYANAGHLWPVLLAGGSAVAREPQHLQSCSGLPLGLIECEYDDVRFEMPSGSRLLFYSDGITEAANCDGEEFGVERLQDRAMQDGFTARDIVNELCMFSHVCPLADDATLVMVARNN
jgi:sigma-B regulation protein RsbU (phosphoserine phosphatase)